MSKVQKIKQHIKDNKKVYVNGISIVVIAGLTTLIMRDRHAVLQTGADGLDVTTVRSFNFNFLARQLESGNVTTVISRDGRGHPGYITRWLEEMIDYETQGLAASEHGVPASVMSAHIQGKIPDVNGNHFVRVSV